MTLSPDATLAEAKSWLRGRLDKGERCPCCTRRAQVYKRHINASMAYALITMYRTQGKDWFYLPDVRSAWKSRDEAMLAYWGLIEEATEKRDDGGRAGWWHVTEKGEAYILRGHLLPFTACVYDGRVLSFEGDRVGIQHALGRKFDLQELLAGL